MKFDQDFDNRNLKWQLILFEGLFMQTVSRKFNEVLCLEIANNWIFLSYRFFRYFSAESFDKNNRFEFPFHAALLRNLHSTGFNDFLRYYN